jgi:L-amino acid N-acyltransferase YncA
VGDSPPSLPAAFVVRDSTEADVTAIQRIYAHYVLNALATFEETPPSAEEMIARRKKVLDLGLPYLVADSGGEISGFCYAGAYHARPAYRHTIENSVYVANGLGGRGIGAALLGELIARCEAGPWRQMIAIIGDSGNAASILEQRRPARPMLGNKALYRIALSERGYILAAGLSEEIARAGGDEQQIESHAELTV